jgi:hypothetical protein
MRQTSPDTNNFAVPGGPAISIKKVDQAVVEAAPEFAPENDRSEAGFGPVGKASRVKPADKVAEDVCAASLELASGSKYSGRAGMQQAPFGKNTPITFPPEPYPASGEEQEPHGD